MTGRQGGEHTVHFPPAAEPAATVQAAPNVFETFAAALRDTELMREKLRGLIVSENRHGDLQAVLSAARRVESSVQALIEAEES
jgi:hypothetical protein